jgi:hypothetical protein
MNKLNFSAEYSQRSDDELLQLASDRFSLTSEASAALDDELHQRNLTESDRAKHQQFVRRKEQREAMRRRRKIFNTRSHSGNWVDNWVDLFWALLATVVISSVYLALPNRYHMKPDWQEAAVHVMFASVFIAVVGRSWWTQIGFWMSLALSSAIHMFVVHAWIQRAGHLPSGKLAVLLGFALFFAVYGFVWLLRRNLYGEEAPDRT